MTGAQHIRNLLMVYDATKPHELADALSSYSRYRDLIGEVASQTGADVRAAVGVFAALSPNNGYVSNLKNCRDLLRAAAEGRSLDSFRVNTYGANKRKAWEMANGVDPLALFKGRKTKAFFLNILDPTDLEPVTVDGHIYGVWLGEKRAVRSRAWNRDEIAVPHLGAKLYAEIADGVRLVAELRGVVPCQAQAVIWQTWRRIHNVTGSAQMELLARDVFAAGAVESKHATGGCGQ